MRARGVEGEREGRGFCVWQLVDIGRRPAATRGGRRRRSWGSYVPRTSRPYVTEIPRRSRRTFARSNHISRSDSRERTDNRYPRSRALLIRVEILLNRQERGSLSLSLFFAVPCKLSKEALARFARQVHFLSFK